MTTTLNKKSSVSQTRINEFKERFIVPFKGTLNKPYEITSVAKNPKAQRPSEDDIIDAMPGVDDYLKTGKSPVTFEGLHLVCVDLCDSSKTRAVDGVCSYDCFLLAINPETGEVTRFVTRFSPEYGLPFHCLSVNARDYFNESQDSVGDNDWFIDDTDFIPHFDTIGALLVDGHLLINADENANNEHEFVSSGQFDEHPTLSFNCLGNLIAKKVLDESAANETIRKAKLKVVDFTPESYRCISILEKRHITIPQFLFH
jgi:hypothetical protein